MMWNCPIEEERQRHQRQKGLPGGSLFVHLLMLQHFIPDFLSCALARHDGFPKDVARAPGSQELTSLCWRLTGRLGHWPASPGGTLEGPGGSQEWPLLWGRTFDNASCVCDLDCKTRGRISQAQWPISGNSSWFNFLLTTCELRKWWRLSGNGHVRARWRARGSELWENSVPPLCWSLETVTVALRASTICKTVQCLPSCFQIQLKHH